jgi:predicted metalloendopeptidase
VCPTFRKAAWGKSIFEIVADHVQLQMRQVLKQASKNARTAPAGSPAQQDGENMADLGGITLAHTALRTSLAKYPEEVVVIDGLTQIWTWKGKAEVLRSEAARDALPPNAYRAAAPLLHLDAFCESFGIKEGDPMWLDPARRVDAR